MTSWREFLETRGPDTRAGLPDALATFLAQKDAPRFQRGVALVDCWRGSTTSTPLIDRHGLDWVLDTWADIAAGETISAGPWRDPMELVASEHVVIARAGFACSAYPIRFDPRPTGPLRMFRGVAGLDADGDLWRGASWTPDRLRAEQYAKMRARQRGLPPAVWSAMVPPEAVLAQVAEWSGGLSPHGRRCWTEAVIDPGAAVFEAVRVA